MQAIFENENERSNSRRASPMGPLICIEEISRCMERECDGRTRNRRNGV